MVSPETRRSTPLRVLVVDDNPDDRALALRALRNELAPLETTEAGTKAQFEASLNRPDMDVVITDFQLRWGDGLQVLNRVRARWPGCAAIMFTDSGSEEIAARAMRDGLDDYIVKAPSRAKHLPAVIQRALTERMHRQRARAAEAQVRALFDRLPVGIYRINEDNRVLYANQTFAELFGFPGAEAVIGTDITNLLVDPEEAQPRRERKADGVTESVIRVRSRDGTVLWVRDTGRLITDVDDTPMYFEGVVQDVTETHEAHRAARRQERFVELLQAVTATANEYDKLDDALGPALHVIREAMGWPIAHVYVKADDRLEPTGIWADDGSDRFGWFREQTAARAFTPGEGLPGRALEGGRTAWMTDLASDPEFFRIGPDSPDDLATGVALPVVLGADVCAVLELFHTESIEPDNELSSVLDQAGVQLGRVAERERAERTRQEMEAVARANQRLEAVGRLAGGIAHDFNNLLTVIRSQADLLRIDAAGDTELLEEIEAIQAAADKGATLTSHLLAFSREQVLEPQVVDLNQLVEGIVQLLHRVIGEDISIRMDLAPGLAPAEVDPGQLEQVLINLAVNARHAMPDGGTLTLRTRIDEIAGDEVPDLEPGRYVCLQVADTGIGMDEDTRERVFEPFFTTKGGEKGTGLGLAMAHGILKQSGGDISVESAPGEGATFYLRLPVTDAHPEASSDDEAPPKEVLPATGGTILVVEDEASVRTMIAKALERSGYEVVAVRDAETALERIMEEPSFDVLLTDLLLPGMTGLELAARIAADSPHLPVVVMSGYAEGKLGTGGEGIPAGVDFLQKPFTVAALVRKIQEANTPG